MGRNLESWTVYYAPVNAYLKHADMDRLRAIAKSRGSPVSTLMRTVMLSFIEACEAGENLTDRHLALLKHVFPHADATIDISCTGAPGSDPVVTTTPVEPATETEAEEIRTAIAEMTKALDAIKGKL